MADQVLILANGDAPTKHLLKTMLSRGMFFVCADGGANAAARYKLQPSAIIGDLDSVEPATLKKFSRATIHKIVDDNSTDLEKTLAWVIGEGYRHVVVDGATGGRLDHFIGNLSAMVKMSNNASIQFVDDAAEWIFIDRFKNLSMIPGSTVSLIPLSRCEGIVTKGLKWNLNFESLELGVRDGTSNLVVDRTVHISVAKGNLILCHQFLRRQPPAGLAKRKAKNQ
jgi:thiamine pyrophosphokinase